MKCSLTGLAGYISDRRVPAPRFMPHSGVTSQPRLLSVAQFPERVFPSGNLWGLADSIRVSIHAAESNGSLA